MSERLLEGAERRTHPRFDLLAQIHVRHAEVDFVLELANVSMSGALVLLGSLAVPLWMTIGRHVELGVIAPDTFETITVRGRIVRLHASGSGHGFGVHFDTLDPDTQRGVDRLVDLAVVQRNSIPRP